jgi:GT2 family glycosyltransferase
MSTFGFSAIVINHNGGVDLRTAVALLAADSAVSEIIVVDNESTDGSTQGLADAGPKLRPLLHHANVGFAAAANAGADQAQGDLLVFLNPDVTPSPGCLGKLAARLRQSPAVVGPVLEVEASASRDAGATINRLGMPVMLRDARPPLYVPGCLLATDRRVFEAVGGFDSRYFLFVEDVEFCWRALLAGYDVAVVAEAVAGHRGGGSAPGGYVRTGDRYVTSVLRMSLRERNTIALFVSCAPLLWLPGALVRIVLRIAAEIVWSVLTGRLPLARALVRAVAWNIEQAPNSWRRRRTLGSVRRRRTAATRRISREPALLRTLATHGWPVIHNTGPPAGPSSGSTSEIGSELR